MPLQSSMSPEVTEFRDLHSTLENVAPKCAKALRIDKARLSVLHFFPLQIFSKAYIKRLAFRNPIEQV